MAGVAPTYRIGPSDFFTSADLEEDAKTLDGQMRVLDGLSWDNATQALFDSWNAFYAQWRGFYSRTFTDAWFGAGWNNGNRDELVQMERRFLNFVEQWQKEEGATFPGGVVSASTGTLDSLGDHIKDQLKKLPDGAWGIASVLIILAIGYFVFQEATS